MFSDIHDEIYYELDQLKKSLKKLKKSSKQIQKEIDKSGWTIEVHTKILGLVNSINEVKL